jgi:hypothetical protein
MENVQYLNNTSCMKFTVCKINLPISLKEIEDTKNGNILRQKCVLALPDLFAKIKIYKIHFVLVLLFRCKTKIQK